MKTTPTSAAQALDRLRGLARAVWSRLQRDDLGDEANAAAQREYAQAVEDLHDAGVSVEVGEDSTLSFAHEEDDEVYDAELVVECIDGASGDPRPRCAPYCV